MEDDFKIAIFGLVLTALSLLFVLFNKIIIENPLFYPSLINFFMGIGISGFIFYITSRNDNKNRNSIRNMTIQDYLTCIAYLDPLTNADKNLEVNFVLDTFKDIVDRAKIHAHLLDVREVKKFKDDFNAIRDTLQKKDDENFQDLLKNLYQFLGNSFVQYAQEYNLKGISKKWA